MDTLINALHSERGDREHSSGHVRSRIVMLKAERAVVLHLE